MACGIDHTNPNELPAFLCRQCNPQKADALVRLQRRALQIENRLAYGIGLTPLCRAELQKELQAVQLEELLL